MNTPCEFCSGEDFEDDFDKCPWCPCEDCGACTFGEYYTVHDDVWAQTGILDTDDEDGTGHLCVGCLEKRLGRVLTPQDFPMDVPINQEIPDSPWTSRRLKDRVSGAS